MMIHQQAATYFVVANHDVHILVYGYRHKIADNLADYTE